MKAEFFLPFVVNDLLRDGKAEVTVLSSADKWYGVTYQEDKDTVVEAIRAMTERGEYPRRCGLNRNGLIFSEMIFTRLHNRG